MPQGTLGLALTGGGARGAYQAGVLRGLAELARQRGEGFPFGVIGGTSAGAINAAFVAASADTFADGTERLANFWGDLRTDDVFQTDVPSLGRIAAQWAVDVLFGKLKKTKGARALLDTAPLRRLLEKRIPFARIGENLAKGVFQAFEVTATDYQTSENVSFVMSRDASAGWLRSRRRSLHTAIELPHVMASAAIPLFFPAVMVGDRAYGDGSLRNLAPLSPLIRLGASRLLVVGVRQQKFAPEDARVPTVRPTVGRVLSVLLNAVMMDALEMDIERLQTLNTTLRAVPEAARATLPRKEIDVLVLQPSEDLGAFAATQFPRLPRSLQYLISGLGSREEASEILSYLMFEPAYCRHLAALGHADVMRRKDELLAFLTASRP